MNPKLTNELKSFENLWAGGFYEGDPLNPVSNSSYGQLGFISVLHATYLRCVKPYINDRTVALEIGPGRGSWTRTLLPAKEVYALDALSEEHNQLFQYLGHPKNVKYFQVKDFKCEVLPENYFDYMFSFACLCHVSFGGITEYAINIFPKLKPGSNCFWLVADYDKYNNAVSRLNSASEGSASPGKHIFSPRAWFHWRRPPPSKISFLQPDENDEPSPGRWYDAGIDRTCSMLKKAGYQVIDPDVGTVLRDPVIHFMKT